MTNQAVNITALVYNLTKIVREQQERLEQLERVLAGISGALFERDLSILEPIARMRSDFVETLPAEETARRAQWECYLHSQIQDLERGHEERPS